MGSRYRLGVDGLVAGDNGLPGPGGRGVAGESQGGKEKESYEDKSAHGEAPFRERALWLREMTSLCQIALADMNLRPVGVKA